MKWAVRATLVVLGLAVSTAYVFAQGQVKPTREALENRVRDYYSAIEQGDFARAWTFFDTTMKRDNPKEQYVKHIGASFGKLRVVKGPEVWLEERTRGEWPLGMAFCVLEVRSPDGVFLPAATHNTKWIWERPQPDSGPEWFLIGGPMRTAAEGRGVMPPKE